MGSSRDKERSLRLHMGLPGSVRGLGHEVWGSPQTGTHVTPPHMVAFAKDRARVTLSVHGTWGSMYTIHEVQCARYMRLAVIIR